MRPESATAYVYRPDLSAQVQEFDVEKAAQKFIGRRAAPIFTTPEASMGYPIIKRENFKKYTEGKRAEGAKYSRITGEFGKGTYDCEEYGLEYPIDDRRRKRYRNLIDSEAAAARQLWYQLLMGHEVRVAALYSGAGFTNHNVTTAWSTTATATPISDIKAGAKAIGRKCGCTSRDLSLIIPEDDYDELMLVAQIIDKVKYTYSKNSGVQPADLDESEVAAMLKLKEVIIARGAYDSTEEGYAESDTVIWTAGVMYLALLAGEGDDLEVPSAARTIMWDVDAPELPVIESYRDEEVRGDVVRARMDTDEVLTAEADLMAYKITNT